ncbi:MAG: chemotaxis protein CheC [Candidatus Omnitrophota bacterium]
MEEVLDLLKEVGSIASCHGGIALSEILGKKIKLSVPAIDLIPSRQRPESINVKQTGLAVFCKILVGLEGEVAFILDEANAYKLITSSYKMKNESSSIGVITEMGLSIIKEVGNVVIGSYLNALSLMLKRMIIPPMPTLISGSIDDILDIVFSPYGQDDPSYLIEAVFQELGSGLKGSFFLVLTPYAAKDIEESCRKTLEDLRK